MDKAIDVRIIKTQNQLINGFLMLLKEKSFDSITVSEICKYSDVHRATFYKHFNDKCEFLNFCIETLLKDVDLTLLGADASSQYIKDSCTLFIKVIFEFIDKYKYVFSTVFSSAQSAIMNSSIQAIITAFCTEKFQLVIKDVPAYKIELLSNFYAGAVIGVVKWYVIQENCTLEDIYTFFEHRIDEIVDTYRKLIVGGDDTKYLI